MVVTSACARAQDFSAPVELSAASGRGSPSWSLLRAGNLRELLAGQRRTYTGDRHAFGFEAGITGD